MEETVASMSAAEWRRINLDVRDQMAPYVFPFVTPISRKAGDERGFAWGTGNYINLRGKAYVLTNEHVARQTSIESLGHLPGPDDEYRRFRNPWLSMPDPDDTAISRLNESMDSTSKRALVAANFFDSVCNPVENELFFMLGFPSSTAGRNDPILEHRLQQNWFNGPIDSPALPFVTQEFRDENRSIVYVGAPHIAVHYPTYANRDASETLAELPNPHGMSGSLLWDTKRVACLNAGRAWSPEDARVCGLVCRASEDAVLAVRIELVRETLLFLLRQEASYFHWHDAGRSAGSELPDWLRAEATVMGL